MIVSVIIPTYKPGPYFEECLESLSKQTLDREMFEIIIVLNGCDEPWHSQIKELIDKLLISFNVRFLQTDHGGVSNARNIAIDNARGEYITFIDDDDYVSPAYLEELLKHSSRDCVALTDAIYFDDESREQDLQNAHHLNFLKNQNNTRLTLFGSRVFFNGPVMKLLHRDIIGERRFDVRFANGEDNLMMFNISDRINSICYTTNKAIYYRRIREASATTRKRTRTEIALNSLKIMSVYLKYFFRNPLGYNLPFVMSRFAAEFKSIVLG